MHSSYGNWCGHRRGGALEKNKMEETAKQEDCGCWGALGLKGAFGGAGEGAVQRNTAETGSQVEGC